MHLCAFVSVDQNNVWFEYMAVCGNLETFLMTNFLRQFISRAIFSLDASIDSWPVMVFRIKGQLAFLQIYL